MVRAEAAQWHQQTGQVANAEMRLKGGAGTWRAALAHNEARMNPCLERAHPVSVKDSGAGKYRLAIEASKTMASCQNAFATLEWVAPAQLVGKWDNGRELRLERR
jgi:hypothetical protein